ncbi:hypothetical protein SDC9_119122 [bioreactor metagenome]|uniref:Uncharacterized protein n=1 Tax=bioreactor metagenome TaxID=1076179 RepID=A0A645C3E8_9ZZZZ
MNDYVGKGFSISINVQACGCSPLSGGNEDAERNRNCDVFTVCHFGLTGCKADHLHSLRPGGEPQILQENHH